MTDAVARTDHASSMRHGAPISDNAGRSSRASRSASGRAW
ncbi:hypothetical protein OH687_28535 [Burkholderia anthina]|nr:hypothetical protein OH687_28535 [Burkholderia anthina]